jgi:hypothetical protein
MNFFAVSVILLLFSLGTIYDGLITIDGILAVLSSHKQDIPLVLYLTATIISFIILGLTLNTVKIWEEYADDLYIQLRLFNVIAVIFSSYMSFIGTGANIILKNNNSDYLSIGFNLIWQETNFTQKLIILLMTLFSASSPVIFSIVFLNKNNKT